MFTAWISQEAMETMRVEPVADGHEPLTSAKVVSKVFYLS